MCVCLWRPSFLLHLLWKRLNRKFNCINDLSFLLLKRQVKLPRSLLPSQLAGLTLLFFIILLLILLLFHLFYMLSKKIEEEENNKNSNWKCNQWRNVFGDSQKDFGAITKLVAILTPRSLSLSLFQVFNLFLIDLRFFWGFWRISAAVESSGLRPTATAVESTRILRDSPGCSGIRRGSHRHPYGITKILLSFEPHWFVC